MKMVAMLRVRNEARWIREVVESIQPVCWAAVVLDDHSEDETPEICESLGCNVFRSEFEGLDEARDKNFLLRKAIEMDPVWILAIDGDEVLDSGSLSAVERACRDSATPTACSFRVRYLWDRRDQLRTDGIYGRFRRGSMFRAGRAVAFRQNGNGGNFHCGNVPACTGGEIVHLGVDLLHLGYLHRDDRIRKFRWYNERDPNNQAEDCYRHMVIGDMPEYPAGMRARWAGPLELAPWP